MEMVVTVIVKLNSDGDVHMVILLLLIHAGKLFLILLNSHYTQIIGSLILR